MRSLKTTILGVLTIVAAISSALVKYLSDGSLPDFGVLAAAVTAGIGLITARDHSVSDKDAGVK